MKNWHVSAIDDAFERFFWYASMGKHSVVSKYSVATEAAFAELSSTVSRHCCCGSEFAPWKIDFDWSDTHDVIVMNIY